MKPNILSSLKSQRLIPIDMKHLIGHLWHLMSYDSTAISYRRNSELHLGMYTIANAQWNTFSMKFCPWVTRFLSPFLQQQLHKGLAHITWPGHLVQRTTASYMIMKNNSSCPCPIVCSLLPDLLATELGWKMMHMQKLCMNTAELDSMMPSTLSSHVFIDLEARFDG